MAEAFAVLQIEAVGEGGEERERLSEREGEGDRERDAAGCAGCCYYVCYGGGVSKTSSEAPWHAWLRMEEWDSVTLWKKWEEMLWER